MQQAELPLRDIHAAPAPPWWPPAWGWWVLAVLLVVAAVWGALRLSRFLARRRYRRKLLAEVDHIFAQWQADQNDQRAVAAISALLRRLLIHAGGRRELAGAVGAEWVEVLQSVAGDDPAQRSAAAALASAPYQQNPDSGSMPGVGDFAALARHWVTEVCRV